MNLSIPLTVTKKSRCEYFNKELYNSNITFTFIDSRSITSTIDVKVQIKYPFGKTSNWVKGSKVLETCKSKILENNLKILTSSPSLLSPLICETSIIESNEDIAGDTYRSLEENVNLLNIEVIAMKSFIEYQMLILRESIKDSTTEKSLCDSNSEIVSSTEEIAFLRNENRN